MRRRLIAALRASIAPGAVLAVSLTMLLAPARASADLPAAIDAVVADAATRLSTTEAGVQVIRSEAVTWSDACLGAAADGEVCAQVLTPGYVIWVGSTGDALRYHTDESGSSVRLAATGITPSSIPSDSLPEGATARDDSAGEPFAGQDVPSNDIALLTSPVDTTSRSQLVSDLANAGCNVVTIAIVESGTWMIFIPGAPPAVNAASMFPESVAPTTPFFVRCDETATGGGGNGGSGQSPFSTQNVDETGRSGNGLIVAVDAAVHDGYDRVVLEFADTLPGELDAASGVPPYRVGYLSGTPTECGSGMPATIEGDAYLEVRLPGSFIMNPETGQQSVSPLEITADLQAIVEIEETCGFEGNSTWILGVTGEQPFRLFELSDPTRLVIDVQTSDSGSAALSESCTNGTDGYAIDYPAGWVTNSGETLPSCSMVNPTAFSVPNATEFLGAAIAMGVEPVEFAIASNPQPTDETVSRTTLALGSRDAVRMEVRSAGSGALPAGTLTYAYIVDLGGDSVFLATTRDIEGQSYAENKDVLDRMIETIEFL
ncbi:MAG: hypothetical protein R3C39_10430 [Dehalococcoidia bacterium]